MLPSLKRVGNPDEAGKPELPAALADFQATVDDDDDDDIADLIDDAILDEGETPSTETQSPQE